MENVKSFEINKIYHITLDTSEFEDDAFQLDYAYDDYKNDLVCIHFIDREQNVKSNLIIPFNNLIINNELYVNFYYENLNNKRYYFYYNILVIKQAGNCFMMHHFAAYTMERKGYYVYYFLIHPVYCSCCNHLVVQNT